MGVIKIRKRKNKNYAYFVTYNSNGEKKEKYIGSVSNDDNIGGVLCPHCKKAISEKEIRRAIAYQLVKMRDRMKSEKKHLTNYSRYILLGEMIDALSEGQAP